MKPIKFIQSDGLLVEWKVRKRQNHGNVDTGCESGGINGGN